MVDKKTCMFVLQVARSHNRILDLQDLHKKRAHKTSCGLLPMELQAAENMAKNSASVNSSVMNMERRSIFQERVVPTPLSSSLYYGGEEDMYVCSSSGPVSQPYSKFKKADGKDDPKYLHSDTQGNWWDGCRVALLLRPPLSRQHGLSSY